MSSCDAFQITVIIPKWIASVHKFTIPLTSELCNVTFYWYDSYQRGSPAVSCDTKWQLLYE